MARKRYQPEQIVAILREVERGESRQEVLRKHGIVDQTYYRWKKMYGGMGISEVQRIRELEKENKQLKQLLGDKELAIQLLMEQAKKRGHF